MPPSLALFFWLALLVGLLWFDPARDRRVSVALWVPVIWMFIDGSRLPSQWLGHVGESSVNALEAGNPLDRAISSSLILLAIAILMSRPLKWNDLLARNLALTAFLSFGLLSVLWSDYPFIAIKRWLQEHGQLPRNTSSYYPTPFPLEAVRTLLRRLCYLLIPLSVLLNRVLSGLEQVLCKSMQTGGGF